MALIIIGVIIVGVFMLLVSFYLAGIFNGIAFDKGYEDGRFFWICFWFGMIGYIAVAALPDRKGNFDDIAKEHKDESKPTEQRTYESTQPISQEQKRKNKRDFVIIGAVIAVVLAVILVVGSKMNNKICTFSDCDEKATMQYFDEDVCEYHYHVYKGY